MNLKQLKRSNFTIPLIVFVFTFCYLLIGGINEYKLDAANYWSFPGFLSDGHIDVTNFKKFNRGVLFPMVNLVFTLFSDVLGIDATILFRLFSAFCFAATFALILPKLYFKIFGTKVSSYCILLFNAFVLFFWGNYLAYPLSDFICIEVLICYFYLHFSRPSIIRVILQGILVGFIINTRPVYQLILPFCIILLFFYSSRRWKLFPAYTLLFVIGFFLVSIPQFYINIHAHNVYSIFLPMEKMRGENLYLTQLRWGLVIEKYETYDGSIYPAQAVFFKTKSTVGTFTPAMQKNITDFGDYFNVFFEHPFLLTKVYLKHFFNGLDIKYRTPYLYSLKTNTFFSLLNYSIIFLFIFYIVRFAKSIRFSIERLLLLCIILSPVILAIPGAVEVRFFLPLYLLIYCTVCFNMPEIIHAFRTMAGNKRQRWMPFATIVIFAAYLAGMMYLSQNTYDMIQYRSAYLKDIAA